MGTPAQVGKYEYHAQVARLRQAGGSLRMALRRILQESTSPAVRALVAQAALDLSDMEDGVNRLDEIGRNTARMEASDGRV